MHTSQIDLYFATDFYCPALKNRIDAPPHTARGLLSVVEEDRVSLPFNISFMVNARPSFIMHAATSSVVKNIFGKPLRAESERPPGPIVGIGTKWLFPETEDIGDGIFTQIEEIPMWFDPGLNDEQRVGILCQSF